MKENLFVYCTILFFLLQGCVAYHRQSVSLYQAANTGKIKVITSTGKKLIVQNITFEDSIYYAAQRVRIKNGEKYEWVVTTTAISSKSIPLVFLKDEKKSVRRTVLLFSPLAFFFILIVGSL